MQADWTHHLKTKEEKERFESYLRNSKGVTDRLTTIIQKWEDEVDSKDLDKDLYDSPGWAAKQADNNGYRRCLRKFKKLLNLDPKENND